VSNHQQLKQSPPAPALLQSLCLPWVATFSACGQSAARSFPSSVEPRQFPSAAYTLVCRLRQGKPAISGQLSVVGFGAPASRQFNRGTVDFRRHRRATPQGERFSPLAPPVNGALWQIPMLGGSRHSRLTTTPTARISSSAASSPISSWARITTGVRWAAQQADQPCPNRSMARHHLMPSTNSLSCFSPEWEEKVGGARRWTCRGVGA